MNFADYPQHIALLTEAALQAADPAAAVTAHLSRRGRQLQLGSHRHTLPENGRIFLIAVGKAAVPMSLVALDQLGDLFSAGLVVVKETVVKETLVKETLVKETLVKETLVKEILVKEILVQEANVDWHGRLHEAGYGRLLQSHEEQPPPLRFFAAGHPLPNEVSLAAANAAAHLLADTTPDDLVICLISGGTSALLSQPRLPLPVWRRLHEALLASGCTIQELNMVRRQLDSIKGGGLARLAAPATCVGLILSDVVGSNLLDIGSGPTVMTDETAETALTVLQRYDMPARLETAVWQTIHTYLTEVTTQPNIDPSSHTIPLGRVHNRIVGDGQMAATAVLARAAQLGFVPQLLTTHLQGEAREVGYVAAALARDAAPNRCFILAGETTVTLRGDGRGGRNQELALAAALSLDGVPGRVIASLATDGEDGPTAAAGAVVTGQTAGLARRHGLEPRHFLARNDSHTFFGRLDAIAVETETMPVSLITTGITGTNVNDILLILTYE